MNAWGVVATAVCTVIASVAASSGFWAFMQRKDTIRNETGRLMLGLAYDRIVNMGMAYIERGWISKDEFEDYYNLLYKPYISLGGNGVTTRIMDAVKSLPLRGRDKYDEIIREAKTRRPESYDSAPVDLHAGVLVE